MPLWLNWAELHCRSIRFFQSLSKTLFNQTFVPWRQKTLPIRSKKERERERIYTPHTSQTKNVGPNQPNPNMHACKWLSTNITGQWALPPKATYEYVCNLPPYIYIYIFSSFINHEQIQIVNKIIKYLREEEEERHKFGSSNFLIT